MPETPSSPDPERPNDDAATTEASTDEAPTTAMPPGPEAPPSPSAPRRLLRSHRDRVVGGVCGGIAEYFRIDPLIVRIAAVALAFLGGASVIAYLAALVLVPADDGTGNPAEGRPGRAGTAIGAVLVVLAGIALLSNLGWHGSWIWAPILPLAVIAGLLALAGRRLLRERGDDEPTAQRLIGAALVVLGILIALLIAAVGAAWATASGGGTAIAVIVIALGVAMIALSARHRSARWLAVPALVLAIPSGVVAAADIDARGGIGQR